MAEMEARQQFSQTLTEQGVLMSFQPTASPDEIFEEERLAALRGLRILDTEPEPVFDRIVQIAACAVDVPMALFSLVDDCRQWFKARLGIEVNQTDKNISFCTFAIHEADVLLVPDATKDERFSDNPFVTGDAHIRFYLGIPVRTRGGHVVGTLCCLDTKPREITDKQLCAMQELARLLMEEVRVREEVLRVKAEAEKSSVDSKISHEKYQAVFEHANIGMAVVAPDGHFTEVNEALCEIVGYTSVELMQLSFQDITHPDDLMADLALVDDLRKGEIDRYQIEKRYRHKLNYYVWVNLHVSCARGADGVAYFVSIVENIDIQKRAQEQIKEFQETLESRIAERTHELEDSNLMLRTSINRQLFAEQALRQREAELSSVIEYANDAYISMDISGIVRAWNRKAEETFGWHAGEAIGRHLDTLVIPTGMRTAHQRGLAHYDTGSLSRVLGKRLELPAVRKNGTTLTVEVRVSAIESDGQTFFSAFLHDISERKELEKKREYDARHDALTGLPNRFSFTEALSLTQARAARHALVVGLLFIDLDGFKKVNDTYGHEGGDELLKALSARMRKVVRQTDQLFRLAGDEFIVIVECQQCSLTEMHLVAHKLIDSISVPVQLGSNAASVGASIGIAMDSHGKMPGPELVKQADFWMYEAKRAGRGTILPALRTDTTQQSTIQDLSKYL